MHLESVLNSHAGAAALIIAALKSGRHLLVKIDKVFLDMLIAWDVDILYVKSGHR